jgi:hypothetical protein
VAFLLRDLPEFAARIASLSWKVAGSIPGASQGENVPRTRYTSLVASPSIDELLSAIRHLPLEDRLRLIERARREATEDTPAPADARQVAPRSLLGLMADEPDVVDEMCALAYEARSKAQMRVVDE